MLLSFLLIIIKFRRMLPSSCSFFKLLLEEESEDESPEELSLVIEEIRELSSSLLTVMWNSDFAGLAGVVIGLVFIGGGLLIC